LSTEPRGVAEVLRAVVEGTAGTTGEAFFRSLTRHLALALELRYCFATRCLDAPPTRVATLAFWDGERYVDNFEYDLWGTPCEEVMAGRDRVFIRDVQKLFPDDRDLVDLDAESYAAVPLQGSSGRVIGHLAVLDTQPLDEAGPELPILRIFAARAAAELERQRATARLERSERRYRQFFEEDISGNFVATPEGRILSCNPAFARLFGFPSKEAVLQDPDWDLTVAADDHPETLARLTREGRLERHERTYRRRLAEAQARGWDPATVPSTAPAPTPPRPRRTAVALADLQIRPDLQPRVTAPERTIDAYADTYRHHGGEGMPPIRAYQDADGPVLTRGFTRLAAAQRAGLTELPCELFPPADATTILLDALGGNRHGLALSSADKRRALDLYHHHLDEAEWQNCRAVAHLIGCSHDRVATWRREHRPPDHDQPITAPDDSPADDTAVADASPISDSVANL